MNHLKSIRVRLGMTQQGMADELGCTQSNVGHYEKGQTLLPSMARKVIDVAAARGLRIGFDHVYGSTPLPDPAAQLPKELALASPQEVTHG